VGYFVWAAEAAMNDQNSQDVMAAVLESTASRQAFTQVVLPAVVDSCLYNLLTTIEASNSLKVTFKSQAGETIEPAKQSDGLAGELYGRRGWISTFSQFKQQ
jgi:hypothetical protein